MDLCIQNIIDWLEQKGIRGHSQLEPDSPSLKTVEWLTDAPPRPGRLYVVPSHSFGEGAILTYENGILFFENEEPETLFNELTNAFHYYNTLENEMLEQALKKDALSGLADTAWKIFGTDVIIRSIDRHPLAKNTSCTPEVLYACRHLSETAVINCDASEYPYENLLQQLTWQPSPEYYTLKSTLWYMDHLIGEIIVYQYKKPLNTGVFYMLGLFTTIVSSCIALRPERYFNMTYLEKELVRILEGDDAETDNVLIALHNLGWEDGGLYSLALVDQYSARLLSEPLSELVGLPGHPCHLIPYHSQETAADGSNPDAMLILCNSSQDPEITDKLIRTVEANAPETWLGVSMPFYELEKLKIYYDQALFAIQYGKTHGIRRIQSIQIIPQALSSVLADNKRTKMLLHPDIDALRRYDQEHQTAYLHTFRIFLYHGRNYQATARILGLHQNTLRYRLRKIEELIGGNLYDVAYREQMMYALLAVSESDPL